MISSFKFIDGYPAPKKQNVRPSRLFAGYKHFRKDIKMSNWVVHITGADDIISQPDELTALREANKLNAGLVRFNSDGGEPVLAVALAKKLGTDSL